MEALSKILKKLECLLVEETSLNKNLNLYEKKNSQIDLKFYQNKNWNKERVDNPQKFLYLRIAPPMEEENAAKSSLFLVK